MEFTRPVAEAFGREQHVREVVAKVFLAPDELSLRGPQHSLNVTALRAPRGIDGEIKTPIRSIAKLDVREIVAHLNREVASRERLARGRW